MGKPASSSFGIFFAYGCCTRTTTAMWITIWSFIATVCICVGCFITCIVMRLLFKRQMLHEADKVREKFKKEALFKKDMDTKLKQIAMRPQVKPKRPPNNRQREILRTQYLSHNAPPEPHGGYGTRRVEMVAIVDEERGPGYGLITPMPEGVVEMTPLEASDKPHEANVSIPSLLSGHQLSSGDHPHGVMPKAKNPVVKKSVTLKSNPEQPGVFGVPATLPASIAHVLATTMPRTREALLKFPKPQHRLTGEPKRDADRMQGDAETNLKPKRPKKSVTLTSQQEKQDQVVPSEDLERNRATAPHQKEAPVTPKPAPQSQTHDDIQKTQMESQHSRQTQQKIDKEPMSNGQVTTHASRAGLPEANKKSEGAHGQSHAVEKKTVTTTTVTRTSGAYACAPRADGSDRTLRSGANSLEFEHSEGAASRRKGNRPSHKQVGPSAYDLGQFDRKSTSHPSLPDGLEEGQNRSSVRGMLYQTHAMAPHFRQDYNN